MIFIIKVTTNKEQRALEMISDKAKKKKLAVSAVVLPHGLRGYVFLEADDRESAEESVFNLPYVKGIIGKTISYEEIKNMVETSAANITIQEGDIVELTGSTLKGEKAKVLRINKQKEELTVSLLGAVVQMQVTVKIDDVKVIRRESEENKDDTN
jgi:transcriptional antiterminator NusG